MLTCRASRGLRGSHGNAGAAFWVRGLSKDVSSGWELARQGHGKRISLASLRKSHRQMGYEHQVVLGYSGLHSAHISYILENKKWRICKCTFTGTGMMNNEHPSHASFEKGSNSCDGGPGGNPVK